MAAKGHALAYVFWHWPRPGVPVETYEAELASFLGALVGRRVPGLLEACSFRVGPLPWGPSARRSFYEDRYVVKDYASLGVLNEAAVTGNLRGPHDSVAAHCEAGTGGLFRLLKGDLRGPEARAVTWLDKPAGKSYASYHGELAALVKGKNACLWQRQMALGPSREFSIISGEEILIPPGLRPISSKVSAVLPR